MKDGATNIDDECTKRQESAPGSGAEARSKKRSQPEDSGAANGGPRTVQRVIEFPKPPAAADVISERIIFEIGGDRFAIKWTAEIEQLPLAGPVAIERKSRLKSDRLSQLRRLV